MEKLTDLLIACTVQIRGGGQPAGTGFFVAPGEVLTCAHVLRAARQKNPIVEVIYNGHAYPIPIEQITLLPEPFPDLALLTLQATRAPTARLQEGFPEHPCVALQDQADIGQPFWTFGHTQEHPEGEPTSLEYEGLYGGAQPLMKFKSGQVKPGSSGSALLNLETGFVCGVMKRTLNPQTDLGGAAIPVNILPHYLPGLLERNQLYHQRQGRWNEARSRSTPTTSTVHTVSAILYTQPGVIGAPEKLVGRQSFIEQANAMLDQSRHVLLTGMAGIGKTAMAATIAEQRLVHGPVIWLQPRNESIDAILEALAEQLDGGQILAISGLEARLLAMRELLARASVRLIVVDDAQNPLSLEHLLQAVPEGLPLLATSRFHHEFNQIVELEQLSPAFALELVENSSGASDILSDPYASGLCALLGYHPYALEIAGARMKRLKLSSKELYLRLATNPLNLAKPGQPGMQALLADSVAALSEPARRVLLSFGAFVAPGLTMVFLSVTLKTEIASLYDPLDELVAFSLAKHPPNSDYYYLHDLTLDYAQKHAQGSDPQAPVLAALDYLASHAQDYDLLAYDLPNLLGAAGAADPASLVRIMSYLVIGGYPLPTGPSYFDERGHSLALLQALDKALQAALALPSGSQPNLHYLLSKRGNAYFDRGDYQPACETYEQALSIAPDSRRKMILLAVLGKAEAFAGFLERSQSHFQQASALAAESGDDYLRGFVLGQESHAAARLQDFNAARRIAAQRVALSESLVKTDASPRVLESLFYALLNLGSAELDIARNTGGAFEPALQAHQRALELADQMQDMLLRGYGLSALVEDYYYLGDHAQAQAYFDQGLPLWRAAGLKVVEEETARFIHLFNEAGAKPNGGKI
jgi:tetratricopeptide (TPR) repeat protein